MNSNKRMRRDSVDGNIEFDSEDVSNSEDEYSEKERLMLEKARKKRTVENFDSEDEVYGLEAEEEDVDDDYKDSVGSDDEGSPKDNDLPDERAWGKKKRAFYSTDYVDQDYASSNRKDLAEAEMEEKEAKNIQKRLAEQLDDADFGLDLFQLNTEDQGANTVEDCIVKTDLSELGKREKQALMLKESPEFQALVSDFKERIMEAKNVLSPFLKLVGAGKFPDCSAVNFVKTKYELILNYCVNITFYLTLKAKRLSVNSHPIIKRLAQYRQLLGQLDNGQGKLCDKIQEILEADSVGKQLYVADRNLTSKEISTKSKEKKSLKGVENYEPVRESMEESIIEEESMDTEEGSLPENAEEVPIEETEITQGEDEKRGITYQIAKNKGLTPHRKKEQRNPRVKHRNKYRKAKIRRKGAVREVRNELSRYDGEISGIKASVKKGIKIK